MESVKKHNLCYATVVIISIAVITSALSFPLSAQSIYLDNGIIRVEADRYNGGAINYLGVSGADTSLVNIRDLGRYIQQSYYSGPNPFIPEGAYQHPAYQGWGWNPVQAGDVYGYYSWTPEKSVQDDTIYVRCIPKQWALRNIDSECTMESWITLDSNRVHVRCRLTNARSDSTLYSGRHQELPALYTVGTLYRLFTYTGDQPFTGGVLTQINNSGPPWEYWNSTECWSALVNDDDWGVGIYNPGTILTVGGFHGTPGGGGPWDNNTGYIAPLHTDLLDHDIVYEYEYTLILGDLYGDIRSYVYSHAPEPGPDFFFNQDRQHCLPSNLTDTSPPYSGFWRLTLDSADPRVILPPGIWQAEDVPVIHITCAYQTGTDQAEIFFAGADGAFSSDRRLTVNVIPDGEVRSYEVDLFSHSLYTGVIKGLRFDPVITQTAGDVVDLYAITTDKITSAEPVEQSTPVPSIGTVAPNPFNPSTTIFFYVPNESPIRMAIYDTAGRRIRTLIDGMVHVGDGKIVWDGRSDAGRPVASGIYYCCLKAGRGAQTRKLVLLR